MSDVISLLKDAPVMNLFVIVGAVLVTFAAAGRAFSGAKSRKIDTVGRVLLGTCGMAMLGAAIIMFLGLRSASARTPVDLTPPSAGAPAPAAPPRVGASAGAPAPAEPPGASTGQTRTPEATPGPTRVLTSPETRVEWGCEESRTAALSFPLPAGSRFVSAEFEILEIDKAKSYERKGPALEADGRTVSGEMEFRGLDRIFFNCPGGGRARVRLKVAVAS